MDFKKGISFMVRVRNEEKTIEKSIRSLFQLTIPYEIIVVLHLCTDKSEKIVMQLAIENSNIKIYKYENKISRAGYELLATDVESLHSFVYYSNWCFKKTNYPWLFKWDADFISTEGLIKFLNTKEWVAENKKFTINCINSTHQNKEDYLMCGLIKYTKYQFWELGLFRLGIESIPLGNDVSIIHCSELTDIKEYWKEEPWYKTEDSEEARIVSSRINNLIRDFGKEPEGLARASNPQCNTVLWNILQKKPDYIDLYK